MQEQMLLQSEHIFKRFGNTIALEDVGINLHYGEVHALVGENGAGKSTFGKIIAAAIKKDKGEICFEGKSVEFGKPMDAIMTGIVMVQQEFNFLQTLSVAENIFLMKSSFYKGGFLQDRKQMEIETRKMLSDFGMADLIDPGDKLFTLSVAEMQIVEIIKAITHSAKCIIMDEPTATLSSREAERLFSIINRLKKEGVGFIFISHRLNEVYQIADRITVLRDGKLIINGLPKAEISHAELIHAMVGREINNLFSTDLKRKKFDENKTVLKVENLSDAGKYVKDVSFQVRSGEIVGISGLIGAGRSELIRAVMGIDRYSSGAVYINGKSLKANSIIASMKAGISYIPEKRKEEGLIQSLSIAKNIVYPIYRLNKGIMVNAIKDDANAEEMVRQLTIKLGDVHHPVSSLSGGNQQKVLLAKSLISKPKVLIIDEPTRGIDIGAKADIYLLLKKLANEGVGILFVSSEIPEVLGIADRILIMRDGRMVKELDREDATEEILGFYATNLEEGAKNEQG